VTETSTWRSAIVFLAIMIAGAVALLSDVAQGGVLREASLALTATAAWCLRAIGVDAAYAGQVLGTADRSFQVSIENDCNGAWAHLVLLASVLAYPASWRQRFAGLLVSQGALAVLNLLRIVALVLIGIHWPELFRAAHVYVFQLFIIGCAVALFLGWADRGVRPAV
jgi:exosortase/archaeosortase family protein